MSRVEIAEADASFSFEMVGGTADGIRQWIAGFPPLEVGDRVVLFLAKETGSPLGPTVGLWQGVFFVGADDTVLNHTKRPLREVQPEQLIGADNLLSPAQSASERRLRLETFLNQVRSWRQR
jgi:hypothetical protein